MNASNIDPTVQPPAAPEATRHFSWSIDKEKNLLLIEIKEDFSDYELLNYVPKMWEENPEILWCNTVVDYKDIRLRNNWTWGALKEVGRRWTEFSQRCGAKPGEDKKFRVAILTENYWIRQIVNNAFAFVFPGSRFRCFKEFDLAVAWATKDEELDS